MTPFDPTPAAPAADLRTARLLVRAWTPADAASLLELIRSENARLGQDFPLILGSVTDEASATEFVAARQAAWVAHTGFAYSLWLATDPTRCLGFVHLRDVRWAAPDVPRAELAYFLRGAAEGQGLMHEALAAVTQAGFGAGLVKLLARVRPANHRSRALLLRVGFQAGGRLRHDFRTPNGELVDVDYFDLLPGEVLAPGSHP